MWRDRDTLDLKGAQVLVSRKLLNTPPPSSKRTVPARVTVGSLWCLCGWRRGWFCWVCSLAPLHTFSTLLHPAVCPARGSFAHWLLLRPAHGKSLRQIRGKAETGVICRDSRNWLCLSPGGFSTLVPEVSHPLGRGSGKRPTVASVAGLRALHYPGGFLTPCPPLLSDSFQNSLQLYLLGGRPLLSPRSAVRTLCMFCLLVETDFWNLNKAMQNSGSKRGLGGCIHSCDHLAVYLDIGQLFQH